MSMQVSCQIHLHSTGSELKRPVNKSLMKKLKDANWKEMKEEGRQTRIKLRVCPIKFSYIIPAETNLIFLFNINTNFQFNQTPAHEEGLSVRN